MAPTTGEAAARSRPRPAPLACQNCRHKHLKCDGGRPACLRCSSAGAACNYLPSRRGQPTRFGASRTPLSQDSAHLRHLAATPREPSPVGHIDPQPNEAAAALSLATPETEALFTAADTHRLVGLYYSRFHPSHPMLVPRSFFSAQQYPAYLVAAVCVVGHHFTSYPPSVSLIQKAFSLASSEHDPESVHRIQALILCAVSFSASSQVVLADDCINRAVRISRTLNLHRLDAEDVSQAQRGMMQRESFRRTWWELYLIDAISALLRHRRPSLSAIPSDGIPLLPCSELLYETGECCSSNLSRRDFERRILLQTSGSFSSQSYRIQAASIIRNVCPLLSTIDVDPAELEAAEIAIATWNLDPPNPCQPSPDASDGIDIILLQAHLYVQVAALFLHVPQSKLPLSASAPLDKTCLSSRSLDTGADDHHTIKSIAASNELCTVAGMPWLREGHSLLLTYGFVLGCAVQLSLISGRLTPSTSETIRQNRYQKILLMLSVLKYMGQTWPMARNALSQLQVVANATFPRDPISANDRSSGPTVNSNGAESNSFCETTGRQNFTTDDISYNEPIWEDMDWFGLFTSINENENDLSSFQI